MGSPERIAQKIPLPIQLWVGLLLVAIAWPLNWLLSGPRTHLLFFPLWLGYILAADGLVWLRRGSSLLRRNRRVFISLFLISAPAWWLFEVINWRTQNWEYVGRELFSNLEYFVLASLSFSTVLPAVFETAELVKSFFGPSRWTHGPVIKPTRAVTIGVFLAGLAMLSLLIAWPRYFFPFVWLSIYFIIEPINIWLGHRSMGEYTAQGNWRPILALWIGALICGFFWEMWNYLAFPKWIYHIPFVDFLHIFEMPILGYGGYLPFSLELFALYHLVTGVLKRAPAASQYLVAE